MTRALRIWWLLVMVAAFGGGAAARADEGAVAGADVFISDLGSQAIAALTDQSVSQQEREQRFRGLLNANFDVAFIGRFVLGRYWRVATDAQRGAYLAVFEDSLVRTYTRRFLDYSGEDFTVRRAVADDGGALVMSTLTAANGEQVRVDWRLRHSEGQFRIIDVIIEGVSMAQTQREEHGAFIDQHGGSIDALIEALQEMAG